MRSIVTIKTIPARERSLRQPRPAWLLLPVLAGCLWVGPTLGPAQSGGRTADIGELVSVLLRKHPYLFDEQARDRLEAAYRDYRPANALDLAEQFDGHGTGRLSTNLPGRLRGDYWCVPGPFEMSLPPGEWEIAVRRGLEHLPLFDAITLKPGETAERTYRPRRWVDMRKRGWLSGDDHVHFRLLNDEDARRLMTFICGDGGGGPHVCLRPRGG